MLTAVPGFILMGSFLERSGIAAKAFSIVLLWLGWLPGGLAISTVALCALLAAATGIVGAVEVAVGLMAIPVMLKLNYNKSLISGTICAGGSLGTIIPPSVVVIVYASLSGTSVGGLFAGILIPGLLMVVLFIGFIVTLSMIRPDYAPRYVEADRMRTGEKVGQTVIYLFSPLLLIVSVVGSIMAGIASPTEASGIGAAGSLVLSILYGQLTRTEFYAALRQGLMITSMIMFIVVGGTAFTNVFMVQGGGRFISSFVGSMELTDWQLIGLFLLITFVAGFVLDWISVVLIFLPIFTAIMAGTGIDPIWFGVMMLVVIQTAYLTPPLAPSIFYLRAVAPPEISYAHMYMGVVPFIIAQLVVLGMVALVPEIATYLPSVLR